MARLTPFQILRDYGLPHNDAQSLATQLEGADRSRARRLRAYDWDYVLDPLTRQIKTLASSQTTWMKVPARYTLYSAYLQLLRKARDKIHEAKDMAKSLELNIPQYAEYRGMDSDGMQWTNWVPDKVKTRFIQEFEILHALHPQGKRLIPFSTHSQRSASDVRWGRLETWLGTEILLRQREEFSGPLIDALQAAQKIVYNRSLTDVCPVDWRHLLTKPAQAALEEWAKASCNGVRDYTKPLEEGEEAPLISVTMTGARGPEF